MSKRKQPPKGLTFASHAVLKAPVAAAYLAVVSNAWARLELSAALFLENMLSEPHKDSGSTMLVDPLGMELFKNVHTWRQRWGLVRTILRVRLTAAEWKRFSARLTTLSEELQKAADKRNDLVHSLWGHTEEHEDCLVKSKPYSVLEDWRKKPRIVSPSELRDDAQQIQKACASLDTFIEAVLTRKQRKARQPQRKAAP